MNDVIADKLLKLALKKKGRIIITPVENGCWVEVSHTHNMGVYSTSLLGAIEKLLQAEVEADELYERS